jgi:hypothetical protein
VRLEARAHGTGFKLHINGPEKRRAVKHFADVVTLLGYQAEYERFLVALGYTLEQFTSERRKWPR